MCIGAMLSQEHVKTNKSFSWRRHRASEFLFDFQVYHDVQRTHSTVFAPCQETTVLSPPYHIAAISK
jgi:hypothetical protein